MTAITTGLRLTPARTPVRTVIPAAPQVAVRSAGPAAQRVAAPEVSVTWTSTPDVDLTSPITPYNGWEFPEARRNPLGVVALLLAVVGGILALIQTDATPGWLLIPGSFGLALLALQLRGRDKNVASMAVMAAIAGSIVAVVNLAFGA
ncbi:hypothetical protein [Propioniciclava soli]|uniref:hypothetical protein n=1 Tax=Propioniciclava soli TaxID=2775081 RepID=UPI001E3D88AB|nr:hypothetical protein [Propioniciclava soli]